MDGGLSEQVNRLVYPTYQAKLCIFYQQLCSSAVLDFFDKPQRGHAVN
ncbi:hypothetical protein PORCRE_436 [Porphyromonas crevioricanis JCM 15906]|uniref:Uncharacterized protein n=1 Tax=Porphyromonas crevioricanis JCM 15906 TaxID=1305617 RepID=S4NBG1_9PORP|nr:hypothetical protein PORCRE_436 [Porphyromonas crevioricanis JCM 15906]GAD07943.1 hypothetical protein PORCAN_1572 [Porphyromonas crevioricanis JCM 13913]